MASLMLLGAELLVWAQSHVLVVAGVLVALVLPGAMWCWARRRRGTISRDEMARIEQRLTHICSAVELLTDTTESALRTAFSEIERLSADHGPGAAHRAGVHRRVKTAAHSGRSAREIAQSEGLSEGEVRLRLRLQGGLPCQEASTAR